MIGPGRGRGDDDGRFPLGLKRKRQYPGRGRIIAEGFGPGDRIAGSKGGWDVHWLFLSAFSLAAVPTFSAGTTFVPISDFHRLVSFPPGWNPGRKPSQKKEKPIRSRGRGQAFQIQKTSLETRIFIL